MRFSEQDGQVVRFCEFVNIQRRSNYRDKILVGVSTRLDAGSEKLLQMRVAIATGVVGIGNLELRPSMHDLQPMQVSESVTCDEATGP